MSRSTIKELNKIIVDLKSLLKPAHCPMCDGSGYIPIEITKFESILKYDSHGNAVHTEARIQDWDKKECQWCYEKNKILKK